MVQLASATSSLGGRRGKNVNRILTVGEDEDLRRRLRPIRRSSEQPLHPSGAAPLRRGPRSALAQNPSPFDGAWTVSWAGFSGQLRELAPQGVTVLNLTDPTALPLQEATRLPDRYPGLRVLFILDTVGTLSPTARRRLTRPGIDILTRHADRAEFEYRLQRLLELPYSHPAAPAPAVTLPGLMPELHDPRSGRLDAHRLAEWFGLPLTALARALGRELHDRPPDSGGTCPPGRATGLSPRRLRLEPVGRHRCRRTCLAECPQSGPDG